MDLFIYLNFMFERLLRRHKIHFLYFYWSLSEFVQEFYNLFSFWVQSINVNFLLNFWVFWTTIDETRGGSLIFEHLKYFLSLFLIDKRTKERKVNIKIGQHSNAESRVNRMGSFTSRCTKGHRLLKLWCTFREKWRIILRIRHV